MNDDLISREALKKALEVTQYNDIDDLTRTERLIDNAPTVLHNNYSMGYQDGVKKVLSERPKGEWIVGEYMDCHSDILPEYTCPFCGEVEYRKYDFCHCGADMRVKDELNNELNKLGGKQ